MVKIIDDIYFDLFRFSAVTPALACLCQRNSYQEEHTRRTE